MVSLDDQVKAYIKKIMSQLNKWMQKSKISKLVIVVTSKETGEHVERWQFDVSSYFLPQRTSRLTKRRSTSSTMTARRSAAQAAETRRMRLQQPTQTQQPTSQNLRSSRRSKLCSDRLQRPSHSYLCWMATAHSTSSSTPMPTARCHWSGETAMPRRSRTLKR